MDERARRWEQRFEWPMVIAALLVIPLLVIEESSFGQPWDTVGGDPQLGDVAGIR